MSQHLTDEKIVFFNSHNLLYQNEINIKLIIETANEYVDAPLSEWLLSDSYQIPQSQIIKVPQYLI
jgi:hypothetical protein